jgi:hypothetical protein
MQQVGVVVLEEGNEFDFEGSHRGKLSAVSFQLSVIDGRASSVAGLLTGFLPLRADS